MFRNLIRKHDWLRFSHRDLRRVLDLRCCDPHLITFTGGALFFSLIFLWMT